MLQARCPGSRLPKILPKDGHIVVFLRMRGDAPYVLPRQSRLLVPRFLCEYTRANDHPGADSIPTNDVHMHCCGAMGNLLRRGGRRFVCKHNRQDNTADVALGVCPQWPVMLRAVLCFEACERNEVFRSQLNSRPCQPGVGDNCAAPLGEGRARSSSGRYIFALGKKTSPVSAISFNLPLPLVLGSQN